MTGQHIIHHRLLRSASQRRQTAGESSGRAYCGTCDFLHAYCLAGSVTCAPLSPNMLRHAGFDALLQARPASTCGGMCDLAGSVSALPRNAQA
jgi:hypothetical protein